MADTHDDAELSEISRAVALDDTARVRELTGQGKTVAWEPSPFEQTALHIAADHGNAEVIPILLDAGGEAFINVVANGWTPLGMAARKGNTSAVRVLLARGADIDARDAEHLSDTPLSDAVDGGFEEVVQVLLLAGANPMLPGWMNLTALDRAEHRYEKIRDEVSLRILDTLLQATSKFRG